MSNVFKGEFKVTTQSLLGKADVKRIRAQLMDEFPELTKRMLDKVLRSKEEVDVHVLKCSNGTQLYVPGDGPPAFFDDGFGGIYPTLFTLWKLGTPCMPEIVTHGPVSKFLLPKERSAGADMMLPGVIVPEDGPSALKFSEGQKRCIRVQGNDMPFAVGKMLVSDADVAKTGMKGKGMAVLHVYRDSLWAYGGRKVPNDGFLADEIAASSGAAGGAVEQEEEEEDDEDDDAVGGRGERRSERRSGGAEERLSGPMEGVEEMPPDTLMEYCFFAALKLTCTDSELPITSDKFYSHHMQPARPAGQPQLDAKKTQWKQIGKFIKHMHKQKFINVRDVKNNITILSADRSCSAYVNFELQGTTVAKAKEDESASTGGVSKEEEVVALRTKPPVVTQMWQPNSYTKPLFEAVGLKDKNATYTLAEAHAALNKYIKEKLDLSSTSTGDGSTAAALPSPPPSAAAASLANADEIVGFLRYAGLTLPKAQAAGAALVSDGYDSVAALRAGELEPSELGEYGLDAPTADAVLKVLSGSPPLAVRAWIERVGGMSEEVTLQAATALAADGFDSLASLAASSLTAENLQSRYGMGTANLATLTEAMAALALDELGGESGGDKGGGSGRGAALGLKEVDPSAVPLDELLLNGLVKLAGGAKKGATFATHMPLADLRTAMQERMTAFHRVEVEGEAPSIRKGVLKLITIEMKRAAGHNKTHVSGLESFCISPEAVAQALKVKLGCTTAVLKLPGNNVKDMEVLLQGHCVQEVVDYLRDVYCIGKEWLDLKLKESKRSNT